jgi:hypothetical protein
VQVKRLIAKRIRRSLDGIDLAADVSAAVSVNVSDDRPGRTSKTRTEPASRPAGGADPSERGRENP